MTERTCETCAYWHKITSLPDHGRCECKLSNCYLDTCRSDVTCNCWASKEMLYSTHKPIMVMLKDNVCIQGRGIAKENRIVLSSVDGAGSATGNNDTSEYAKMLETCSVIHIPLTNVEYWGEDYEGSDVTKTKESPREHKFSDK